MSIKYKSKETNTDVGIQLQKEQELKLIIAAQQGNEFAMEQLTKSFSRLVICLARKMHKKNQQTHELEDWIQEGHIGFIKAVYNFDPSLNTRLSTYANYWILQSFSNLQCAPDSTKQLELPINKLILLKKIKEIRESYMSVHNEYPSDEFVAREMKENPKKINQLMTIENSCFSLDTHQTEQQNFHDLISDNSILPDEVVEQSDNKAKLIQVMSDVLSKKEQEIIRMRYLNSITHGNECSYGSTLEEVALMKRISCETVRATEIRAIRKLKGHLSKLCFA